MNNILFLDTCTNISVLGTVLFFKKLVKIISIIVPVLLVLLITIDFTKAVMANSDDDMKKAQSIAIKRIIAGLIVFFIPLIVDTAFTTLSDKGVAGLSCYANATDDVVNALTTADKEKILQDEEERQELIKKAKKNATEYRNTIQELRKGTLEKNQELQQANAVVSDFTISTKNVTNNSTVRQSIQVGAFKVNLNNLTSSNTKVAHIYNDIIYLKDIGNSTITGNKNGIRITFKLIVTERTSKPTIGEAAYGNNGYGDQSGKEVRTRNWYINNSFGNWNYLFRFADPVKADIAASAMIQTCKNDNIGYENSTKSRSMSFTYALKKASWDPKQVKTKCGTACSQCVLTMVQVAGLHRESKNYAYKNAANGARVLKNDSNFITIKNTHYTKSYKKLRRGDILVDTSGSRHMIMVVK